MHAARMLEVQQNQTKNGFVFSWQSLLTVLSCHVVNDLILSGKVFLPRNSF